MEPLLLNVADLRYHVVTLGMDIYPPVEIPDERTRLNMFYEEVRDRWGSLFDRLVASDTEFRISKSFRKQPEQTGPSYPQDTFVLTNRGPVYVFPLILPDPVGDTGLEKTYVEDFDRLRRLFFNVLSERAVMRIGLVRDLVFATGQTKCEELITDQGSFANADLVGGQLLFKYRDAKYNHNIRVDPVSITKTTQLAVGTRVTEATEYGVRVCLDVNNSDTQSPLQEPDIHGVLDRATSLWPDELLKYVGELSNRRE